MRTSVKARVASLSAALVALVAGTAHGAWPAPYLQAYQAGFTDAEHTLAGGVQVSSFFAMNSAEQVIGTSQRADGGQSAWSWTYGTGTIRIGLVDPLHTGASNQQESTPRDLSNTGVVAGLSTQYDGDNQAGTSAWAWTSTDGTTRLGFTDAEHTDAGGFGMSGVRYVANSGIVTGTSNRYDPSGVGAGTSVWAWTHANGQVQLGFTDAEHTSTSGYRSSGVEAGLKGIERLTGSSLRFSGEDFNGTSVWTWSPLAGQSRVGLLDAAHTGTGGYQESSVSAWDNNRVVGSSTNYVGGTGASAWLWTQTDGTTRIGLLDGEHTSSSTGLQNSGAVGLMSAGRVVGTAVRFNASGNENGQSTWVYTPGSGSTKIGLFDAEHTNPVDGTRQSSIGGNVISPNSDRVAGTAFRYSSGGAYLGTSAWTWSQAGGNVRIGLTDSGHTSTSGTRQNDVLLAMSHRVVGTATHYSGANQRGTSVWTWSDSNPGTTLRIGLFNTPHTATDGTQITTYLAMNDAGYIIGQQSRYAANLVRGQSGWFFDPADNAVLPLVFSTGLQNRALTVPTILTDTGLVLGYYDVYANASASTPLGQNAFLWSRLDGVTDLGTLVNGGLSAFGWSALNNVLSANELAAIAGYGTRIGAPAGSQAVYVLTVPAPTGIGMLAMGGVAALRRRRARFA